MDRCPNCGSKKIHGYHGKPELLTLYCPTEINPKLIDYKVCNSCGSYLKKDKINKVLIKLKMVF